MRASARELLVPFLTPLVWRDRGANPRPTAPEADALTTRLTGKVGCKRVSVTQVCKYDATLLLWMIMMIVLWIKMMAYNYIW